MSIKTGTLTFHASHNYGSMLQAYALQQVLIELYGHNEIINFRTLRQKKMMIPIGISSNLRALAKSMVALFYLSGLRKKHNLFEKFLSNNFILSEDEYSEAGDINFKKYDILVTGSDQIWNPNPVDFDMVYYLPYEIQAKKISYAASMGPQAIISTERGNQISEAVKDYDKISVREIGTKIKIQELSGRTDIEINCDPVLLLSPNQWTSRLITDSSPEKSDYILLYSLFQDDTIVECAKKLEKIYNIPVIITSFTNSSTIFSNLKKRYACGPIEFLNYLYHARGVITSSFHGTAFSVLFNKPFISINGMADNRISNLLRGCKLEKQSISSVSELSDDPFGNIDFSEANEWIHQQREVGYDYLKSCR